MLIESELLALFFACSSGEWEAEGLRGSAESTRASGGGAQPSVVVLQLPFGLVHFGMNSGKLTQSLVHRFLPCGSSLHPPWVILET